MKKYNGSYILESIMAVIFLGVFIYRDITDKNITALITPAVFYIASVIRLGVIEIKMHIDTLFENTEEE